MVALHVIYQLHFWATWGQKIKPRGQILHDLGDCDDHPDLTVVLQNIKRKRAKGDEAAGYQSGVHLNVLRDLIIFITTSENPYRNADYVFDLQSNRAILTR